MLMIRLCAVGVLVALSGCAPMPKLEPIERSTFRMTGIENAVVFRTEAEPLDVAPGVGPRLTLPDAIKLSLAHDPRIQSAIARVRQAEAESQQSRLLPNPVLDISLRIPKGGGGSIVDVGLAADLLAVVQMPGRISAADHRLRVAAAESMVVVLDVVGETRKQYALVQWLDERVTIAAERGKGFEQLRTIARSQADAGESSQADVLTLDAEYTAIASERIEVEAERQEARIALCRLIGAPSSTTDWVFDPWISSPLESRSAGTVIQRALETRPEVAAQAWRLAALGENARQASIFEGTEVGATAERDGEWSVGPAVTVPLPAFDWGQARRQQAEAQVIEARHDLTQARRLVVQEVRQAISRLELTEKALKAIDSDLVPKQNQRLTQAKEAYSAGLSDITAVRFAERDLQSARERQIELRHKLSTAAIDLDRAVAGSGSDAGSKPALIPATRPANP